MTFGANHTVPKTLAMVYDTFSKRSKSWRTFNMVGALKLRLGAWDTGCRVRSTSRKSRLARGDPAQIRLQATFAATITLVFRSTKMAGVRLAGARNWVPANKDLRQADLSGADLSGCDLSGCDLSGADLTEANLESANLETVKTGKHFGLLNVDEHAGILRKNGRDFGSARPDITHQCLLMLLDSPLNRSGLLQVYIHNQKAQIEEGLSKVSPINGDKKAKGLRLSSEKKVKDKISNKVSKNANLNHQKDDTDTSPLPSPAT